MGSLTLAPIMSSSCFSMHNYSCVCTEHAYRWVFPLERRSLQWRSHRDLGTSAERRWKRSPGFTNSWRSRSFSTSESGRMTAPPEESTMDEYVYPLNSRRLRAAVINQIARGLGLPTNASPSETSTRNWKLV